MRAARGLIAVHPDGGSTERIALRARNCIPLQPTSIPSHPAIGSRSSTSPAAWASTWSRSPTLTAPTVTAVDRHPGRLTRLAEVTGCDTLLLEEDAEAVPVFDVVGALVIASPTAVTRTSRGRPRDALRRPSGRGRPSGISR
ncbi:hypothetical protein [Actinomadura terrae]|uniref:hypothetical protein n=1 Tax=Actinomadura terrae TaxID=604353 RepID=UPI001FA7ED36|nr:hypothetical protein [Actinomadura terrae]